jgi:hypothetical protein
MPTNITYRTSVNPTTPTSITAAGVPLTHIQVDGNFKSLSDAIDLKASQADVNNSVSTISGDAIAFAIALG